MIISLVEILVEMELFSRKLSSTDNEEIWFPIFSLLYKSQSFDLSCFQLWDNIDKKFDFIAAV